MSHDNRMYIHCPECGYALAKSSVGTNSEQKCPKCRSELRYIVKEGCVQISIVSRRAS